MIVDFYEQVGYLPDAILNYLLLLGWSLDDKTETFSRAEMIQAFSLERVNKSPASFDVKKLSAFQERYMLKLPLEQKLDMVLPYLVKANLLANPVDDAVREQVRQIVQAAGDRIKMAGDILDYADFFLPDEQVPYGRQGLRQAHPQAREGADAAGRLQRRPRAAQNPLPPLRWSSGCKASCRSKASNSATSSMPCAWPSPARASASACTRRWPSWASRAAWPASRRALAA